MRKPIVNEFDHTMPDGSTLHVLTQAEAARRCNMSRQNFKSRVVHNRNSPEYATWLVEINGLIHIRADHPDFIKFCAVESKATHREKAFAKYKAAGRKGAKSESAVLNRIKKAAEAEIISRDYTEGKNRKPMKKGALDTKGRAGHIQQSPQNIAPNVSTPHAAGNFSQPSALVTISPTGDPQRDAVLYAALVERSKNEQEISKAAKMREMAIQAQLVTLDRMKHTAPIEVIRFYFSFAENMIQQLYRRPHEIEAELEALFMSGEKKKATEKLIREMEAIVKNSVGELRAAMEKEKFELSNTGKEKQ